MHNVSYVHAHGSTSLAMLNINTIKPHYVCVLPIPYQRAKLLCIFITILNIIIDIYYQHDDKVNVWLKT